MEEVNIKVTDDIEIRTWKIEDAPELFALSVKNKEYLRPWLPWVPFVNEVTDSENFILKSLSNMKGEKGLELGIRYQGKLVGCFGLININLNNKRASIGYWLDQGHSKKGIMTESIKALISYAFKTLNLNRLGIEAAVDNGPSNAVAQRLGFIREGILRQYELTNGKNQDYVGYSMLKSEWKK